MVCELTPCAFTKVANIQAAEFKPSYRLAPFELGDQIRCLGTSYVQYYNHVYLAFNFDL